MWRVSASELSLNFRITYSHLARSANTDDFHSIHESIRWRDENNSPRRVSCLEYHRLKTSTAHIFYSPVSFCNTNPIQQLNQEQCKTRQKPCRTHPVFPET